MASDREEREWSDPANWHGGPLGIYVAPRDPRVWVPKRVMGLGWTLNLAHRAAWGWLAALLVVPAVVLVVSGWLERTR